MFAVSLTVTDSVVDKWKSSLHIVIGLLVEFAFLLGGGILVLLILRHKIIHVGLSFGELHLVHALACVPVQECFASEHG